MEMRSASPALRGRGMSMEDQMQVAETLSEQIWASADANRALTAEPGDPQSAWQGQRASR